MRLTKDVVDTLKREMGNTVDDFTKDGIAQRLICCPQADVSVLIIKHPLAALLGEEARYNIGRAITALGGGPPTSTVTPVPCQEDQPPRPSRN